MPTTAASPDLDTLLQNTLARAAELRRLPVSTYRLQFHKGFTFADATKVLPYLARLGITHVYASPYLKATPGSTHGYDVIDHCKLNPEVGTTADYDAFLAALDANGLTHILDTVPNHVGVATNENTWWNDVLEHGPASRFSGYFDITWQDRPGMKDKVLLPTLGKPYGEALEAGELKLLFEADAGTFAIDSFGSRFPVSPATYGRILMHRGGARELAGLIEQIDAIPAGAEERHGESQNIKARLAALVAEHGGVRRQVESAVEDFNGKPGDAASFDALDGLLTAQHFRLADWHVAFDEINYRRFFDVNSLAALAMEKPEVFEATHALILPLLAAGEIAGLRIDHPDGLFDPAAYLLRLQQHYLLAVARTLYTGDHWPAVRTQLLEKLQSFSGVGDAPDRWPLYVSVEKILAMHEPLIADWATDGTSGYDFLVLLNALFVDPAAETKFDGIWNGLAEDHASFADLAYRNKRHMMETSLASELHMLTLRLIGLAERQRRGRDFTFRTLQVALREMIAGFGVYRTYVLSSDVTDVDRKHVRDAAAKAEARNPRVTPAVFDFVVDMLTQQYPPTSGDDDRAAQLAFAGKFQQLTSPVTAKGIEDTTFYQYNRYLTLNEVGGDPSVFGITPDALHAFFADRQTHWPYALSASSTHDTKRSEDVRARLNVLSETPDDWAACVAELFEKNADLRGVANAKPSPAPEDEYLIYQTVLGAWPMETAEVSGDAEFADRIQAYTLKAIREAKLRTRWGEPDAAYEAGVKGFIDGLLGRPLPPRTRALLDRIVAQGARNGLAQTVIKLLAPGVPDTYQGTELWDLSLVDPDNRRPVDYARRERLLTDVDAAKAADLMPAFKDGRIKLKVTAECLRLRRDHADLFGRGAYTPVPVSGPAADRVVAFTRTSGDRAVLVAAMVRSAPDGTAVPLPLPAGTWTNVLAGTTVQGGGSVDVFGPLPVAVLVRA